MVLWAAITTIYRFIFGFDTAVINGVLLLPSGSVGLKLRMFNRVALCSQLQLRRTFHESPIGRNTGYLVPPGGRGGHPSPAATERSVQFSRTTLIRSWFTALWLELAVPHRGDAAWLAEGTGP